MLETTVFDPAEYLDTEELRTGYLELVAKEGTQEVLYKMSGHLQGKLASVSFKKFSSGYDFNIRIKVQVEQIRIPAHDVNALAL